MFLFQKKTKWDDAMGAKKASWDTFDRGKGKKMGNGKICFSLKLFFRFVRSISSEEKERKDKAAKKLGPGIHSLGNYTVSRENVVA